MKTYTMQKTLDRKADRKRRLKKTVLLTAGTLLAAFLLAIRPSSPFVVILFTLTAVTSWIAHWRIVLTVPEKTRIPVLMYHSVSPSFSLIPNRGLSVSPSLFESHLNYLKKRGYKIVSLEEIIEHMQGGNIISGKKVCITFDDGYQDNYTYAFPLLKRFGFKATVFMSTDFIRSDEPPDEILKKDHPAGPDAYLSWKEISEMEDTGIIHVESHGRSHRYRFIDDIPVGFFNPSDTDYYWYTWNIHPDHKPYWHLLHRERGKGHPIFQEAPSLQGRAFLPDRELLAALENIAADLDSGKPEFEEILSAAIEKHRAKNGAIGRFETTAEFEKRVIQELVQSRKILEQGTGRKIKFFAWPNDSAPAGGIYYALEKAGYAATTAGSHYNNPGEFDGRISRIYTGERLSGIQSLYLDTLIFGWQLKLFEGRYCYYFPIILTNLIQKFYHNR